MNVSNFKNDWLEVFIDSPFDEHIASEEFEMWVVGISSDSKFDNENTQDAAAVTEAAREAIRELMLLL